MREAEMRGMREGAGRVRLEDDLLLALKMGEGATNEGMPLVAEKARNEFFFLELTS